MTHTPSHDDQQHTTQPWEETEGMEWDGIEKPRRHWLSAAISQMGDVAAGMPAAIVRARRGLLIIGSITLGGYLLYTHPPFQTVERGELGLRINQWSGGTDLFQPGKITVIPGVHELRHFPMRDQIYRPVNSAQANGSAPFQSVEGLSLGVDVSVRYALDQERLSAIARMLPEDIGGEIVAPQVEDVLYKTLSRYTVREIFSVKRQEIQDSIKAELGTRLKADGIVLKAVTIGNVDLPNDYKTRMESVLSEELNSEKMRYTLDLKEKKVKESELEALAKKVSREKAAEAAAEEEIIAAKAQAEAMKHILPFKEKQIQQRAFEAEADRVTRLKQAETAAQARRIEAEGEADSRRKLAEAEAYRQEIIGKVNSEQMERDGRIIGNNPLLIQKAMADKLSDKISVIIAPPSMNGGFVGENLIGRIPAESAGQSVQNDMDEFEE